MYTYNCVGIGLQVSQHPHKSIDAECKSFLKDIETVCYENVLETLATISKSGLSDKTVRFLNWCSENADLLKAADVDIRCNYHGAEEYPILIGCYINDLFPIPSDGAARMNLEHIAQILKKLTNIQQVFQSLDSDILDILTRNNLINIWINNHSS